MKKLFFLPIILSLFFFTSCEKDEDAIEGCMDECATNYNSSATEDDGSCMYSFLGTYTISDWKIDGVSIFSSSMANPAIAGAIAFSLEDGIGVYASEILATDGTYIVDIGTFENSSTQLIFYSYDSSVDPVLWNTTKINCLEFDGNTMIDGQFHEIELTYYGARLDNFEKTPTSEKFSPNLFKKKN